MNRLVAIDAEQSVLGGIMQSGGKAMMDVQDILGRDDFARADHKVLWDACCALDELDSPIDMVTVMDWLKKNSLTDEAGGQSYIGSLVLDVPGAANIRSYAGLVKERSTRRELVQAANDIRELAEDTRPMDDVLADAQTRVMDIGIDHSQQGPVLVKEMMPAWMENLDTMFHMEQSIPGLSTGYRDLDRKINGLQKQNLVVIAGRPSMGKTALAMNIANAVGENRTVLVFSMEMSMMEIVTRSVAQHSKVPLDRLLSGNINDEQWDSVGKGASHVEYSKILIDESPAMLMAQIRARSRRVMQQHPDLAVIVVDYLQLMSGDAKIHRAQQISDITRGLKALAKEMNIPILALSQLNRDVDKRDDKRPRLSDLRESGSIEQDADVILFIYRDVVYDEKTKWKKVAEIIVGKQRNGPTGTVLMYYFGEYTMFGQMEGDAQQEFWHDRHSGRRPRSRDHFDDSF
jgi:replicative DNA helicase